MIIYACVGLSLLVNSRSTVKESDQIIKFSSRGREDTEVVEGTGCVSDQIKAIKGSTLVVYHKNDIVDIFVMKVLEYTRVFTICYWCTTLWSYFSWNY